MRDTTPWVINASPLILLAKLGRTALLDGLNCRILVPEAVVREVAAGGNTGAELATALDFAKSRTVADISVPGSILGWDLGDGESQVLAHCLAGGYLAVLDDGEARAAAKVHAVPHVGTLGVILRAKRANLIPTARPLVKELVERGSYLSGSGLGTGLGCGVCATVCKNGAALMKSRPRRILAPETIFDQVIAMAIEWGKLADLLFTDSARLSHRALGRWSEPWKAPHPSKPPWPRYLPDVLC